MKSLDSHPIPTTKQNTYPLSLPLISGSHLSSITLHILEISLLRKTLAPSLYLAAPLSSSSSPLPYLHLSISTTLDLHLLYSPMLGSPSTILEKAWIFRISFTSTTDSSDLHRVAEIEVEHHSWSLCSAYPLCDWGHDYKGVHSFSDNGRGKESTMEHASQSSEKGVEME
ncbi:hypothetical protein V2J09_023990 [Rumex salicifolius]